MTSLLASFLPSMEVRLPVLSVTGAWLWLAALSPMLVAAVACVTVLCMAAACAALLFCYRRRLLGPVPVPPPPPAEPSPFTPTIDLSDLQLGHIIGKLNHQPASLNRSSRTVVTCRRSIYRYEAQAEVQFGIVVCRLFLFIF